MNIGIDIDDTITNSSEIFIKYAREYNKLKKIHYNINVNEFDQSLAFGWNMENQKEFADFYLEKILNETVPHIYSADTITKLKKINVKFF